MKKIITLLVATCMIAGSQLSAKTLNLTVKGMHCSSCEAKFKTAASEIKGIQEVTSVSASTGTAVITYDEKLLTPDKAVKALADKSGFTVSASTGNGVATAKGNPAACCAKGQSGPACKKGDKEKAEKVNP